MLRPSKANPPRTLPLRETRQLGTVGSGWILMARCETDKSGVSTVTLALRNRDGSDVELGAPFLLRQPNPPAVLDERGVAFESLEAGVLRHARRILAKAGLAPYAELYAPAIGNTKNGASGGEAPPGSFDFGQV